MYNFFNRFFLVSFLISLIFSCCNASQEEQDSLKLWYKAPAADWNEALPIGNGRLGAMVYGIPGQEKFESRLKIVNDGGSLSSTENSLALEGANSATLIS